MVKTLTYLSQYLAFSYHTEGPNTYLAQIILQTCCASRIASALQRSSKTEQPLLEIFAILP